MTRGERLRCVVIVCCYFLRNLAYYRVGWKHRDNWRELTVNPNASFWRAVSANFIDFCVLDWCKLFGDDKNKRHKDYGEHYWGKIVSDPQKFESELLQRLKITTVEFESFRREMREYRDKFLAHLDSDREMRIPKLDLAKGSVEFYCEYVMQNEAQTGVLTGLPDTTEKLQRGYPEWQDEAERVYRQLGAKSDGR